MKNTLIISTYFNNSHFIELQQKSFQKFVQDDFDFAVIDDAGDHTKALLTGNSARQDTINETRRLGVRYIEVPQSVHNFTDLGGLVQRDPLGVNLDHPTERHQAVLRYILNNYKALGFDQYKTLVLMDADMFFKKPINISEYMEDYDMLGSWREHIFDTVNITMPLTEEFKNLKGKMIKFFTLCLLFINMEKVTNLTDLDNRSFLRVSDTGGRTKYFIDQNPQYKFGYFKDFNSGDYRVDFFSKTTTVQDEAEIIHYRGGSNSSEYMPYYKAKLNNMLKRFLPEFTLPEEPLTQDVISANKEHIIKTDGTIISKYGV